MRADEDSIEFANSSYFISLLIRSRLDIPYDLLCIDLINDILRE